MSLGEADTAIRSDSKPRFGDLAQHSEHHLGPVIFFVNNTFLNYSLCVPQEWNLKVLEWPCEPGGVARPGGTMDAHISRRGRPCHGQSAAPFYGFLVPSPLLRTPSCLLEGMPPGSWSMG